MSAPTLTTPPDVVVLPVTDLHTHPSNPRRGDLDALRASIEAHGFYGTLVVQSSTRAILAGNHRYLAAVELGYTELPCWLVDVDDDQALRILLADNRASDLATYDEHELLALLSDLVASEDELAGMLFTVDDLEELAVRAVDESDDSETPDVDEPAAPADEGYSFGVYGRELIVETALSDYRASGWPDLSVPRHAAMLAVNALAATPTDRLVRSKIGYSAADSYHPHRFDGHERTKISARAAFDSDKHLRHALDLSLSSGSSLSPRSLMQLLGITQYAQCVANFRPAFALLLLRKYAPPDAVVLDTSTGYGGRLLGFLASDCGTYIGIDPSTMTYDGNRRMAKELGLHKTIELHCEPAEDFDQTRYAGNVDICLTSPPYFDTEVYCDEPTQAAIRYPKPAQWRQQFLRPMLALQFAALKAGGVSVLNIAPITKGSKTLPLDEWAIDAAQEIGFRLDVVEQYQISKPPGQRLDERTGTEPVLILRKD